MRKSFLTAIAAVGALALSACSEVGTEPDYMALETAEARPDDKPSPAPAKGDQTIAEIVTDFATDEVEEDREFTLLLAAINYIAETNPSSDLIAGLFNSDQYTVFAPTDEAFGNLVAAVGPLLSDEALEVLAEDGPFAAIDFFLGAGTVETVVKYHVTDGRRAANSVVPKNRDRTIETLAGATFSVSSEKMITAVGNTAMIVGANVSASNGIIHVIDAVILPIDLGL